MQRAPHRAPSGPSFDFGRFIQIMITSFILLEVFLFVSLLIAG